MKIFLLYLILILTNAVNAQQGSLDLTFSADGKVTTNLGNSDNKVQSVAIQSDGKIVVAGYSGGSPTYRDFALVRYNTNGTVDSTFGSAGKAITAVGGGDGAYSLAIQNDDKIVVAGNNKIGGVVDFALVRYNSDGSLDSTFDADGKVTTDFGNAADYCYAVAIQNDGKILAAGLSSNGPNMDFALARYQANGKLDSTFNFNGKAITNFNFNSVGKFVAMQNDGKILVSGFCNNGSNHDFALARYNNDGSLDNTFDSDGKVSTDFGGNQDFGLSIAVQLDDKIVLGGYSDDGSDYDFAIARYNNDGSLDTAFNSDGRVTTDFGNNTDDKANSVAIQPNGKILVAGYGSEITGDFAIARYNNDGSPDSTFGTDGKVTTAFGCYTDVANSMAIQNDNKIVVAGFSDMCTTIDFSVARYDAGTVGMQENILWNELNIFPNPTSGIFTVNLHNCWNAKICVYDVLGNYILKKDCGKDVGPIIDLSSQAKGIYYMEIISDGKRSMRKIVLQ